MTLSTDEATGTVHGEMVQVCIDGVMSVYQDRMRDMLDEEDIERPDPRPDEWYPLEKFLDVLTAVERNTGKNALSKIGESTPRFLDWPTAVDSPAAGLRQLADVYEAKHRQPSGGYTCTEVDESTVEVISTTPYPTQWEKGFLKGTAQQFGAGYAHIDIVDEGESTTFEVSW